MKKFWTILASATLALTLLAGCGSNGNAPASSAASSAPSGGDTELTGSVATDGSTSMKSVIGALGESFQNANSGVTFTYNPTGSGSGIQAVSEGRCDIGLASRSLKDDEKSSGLTETSWPTTASPWW